MLVLISTGWSYRKKYPIKKVKRGCNDGSHNRFSGRRGNMEGKNNGRKIFMRSLAVVFMMMFASVAAGAEITVVSGGATEPGLNAAADAFQKETGHAVKITYNTTPQMLKRIGDGDIFDVVIAPPAAIKEFAAAGKVEENGVNLGRVGIGIMIRPGAPVPDISSAEAIKRDVLEAESVLYNRASSGLYIEGMLKKMGILAQAEAKATRYATGAETMDHVLRGKGKEFAFGPITEILTYKEKGLVLVGSLPAEVQNYTAYIAVPMTKSPNKEIAQAFVSFCGGPGKPLFVSAGIE
jgi:molybdate transport system substrate-binding protein